MNLLIILVKLYNAFARNKVNSNNKILKSTKINIREDLTLDHSRLLKMSNKVGKNGKTWTNSGTIFIKLEGAESLY